MTVRNYTNTATEATLTGSITGSDSTIPVTSYDGFPTPPYTAAIDRGTASEEILLVTAYGGGAITATRGYDGTTAKSHDAGAPLLHVTVAKDYVEANTHVNATAGVHGLAGSVVGTSDTQTLSNKTLVAPALQSPTTTGTASFAGATFSATVTLAGALTLAGFTATSGSVNGPLTVTGATTVPVPTAGAHAARKDYVDSADTALGTRVTAAETTLTAATALATPTTLAKRDASGRLAVANPTAAGEAANKTYVDTADTALAGRLTTLEADTGWTSLTPDAGWSTGAGGHCRYRVRSGVCYFAFYLARASWSAGSSVLTMPVGARPTAQLAFPVSYANGSNEVTLTTTGVFNMVNVGSNGIIVAGSYPVS